MDDIRVALWGLGAMGSGMARVLSHRKGIRLVGVVDSDPQKVGRSLRDVAGIEDSDLTVVASMDEVGEGAADVCIVATSSFVSDVKPQIEVVLELGMDCISIAEEMAYPSMADPKAASEINLLARKANKTVLGTGVNPGFILDTLVIALTGACIEVESIHARRVNDLSPFGPTVMKTQGVGTTPEEFAAGIEDGTIVGHVGFPESMAMIARALGWKLDGIEQDREPIVAAQERTGEHIRVPAGRVAGCNHRARGFIGDRKVITLEHPQQVQPSAADVDTGDFIEIRGEPGISMEIKPEIPGGLGTIAVTVNSIPGVVAASSGLVTMADLPVPRNLAGDAREILKVLRDPGSPGAWEAD